MMKKLCLIALMISIIAANPVFLMADEVTNTTDIATYRMQMGDKFARGVKNVLFGWTEAPKRIVDITKETKNPIWGLLAGGFQGTLKALARTISGVSDIVTAPITPDKGPLIQADIGAQ